MGFDMKVFSAKVQELATMLEDNKFAMMEGTFVNGWHYKINKTKLRTTTKVKGKLN